MHTAGALQGERSERPGPLDELPFLAELVRRFVLKVRSTVS